MAMHIPQLHRSLETRLQAIAPTRPHQAIPTLALIGVVAGLAAGCVTTSVPNAAGVPPKSFDPGSAGPLAGIGIEGHDIVSMTDQMMRDMLGSSTLAGRAKPPRVVIDSQYFRNEGSQAINRDLITDRLRVNLNRASLGRMTFVTRTNLNMVSNERDTKRAGVTDTGTTGLTKAMMGADYRLTGAISTLDSRSVKSGLMQRFNQISFEMVDLESGEIAWSGLYEFARSAADDVVYR
jgi:hypothetical protein